VTRPHLHVAHRRRWAALCTGLLIACVAWQAPSARAATPTVTATWVTDVTATSANLRAQIDPGEFAATYRFEYLTEAAFQANLAANPPREEFAGAARMPAGVEPPVISASVPVFQHLASLPSSTTYRFRVVAAFGSPRETVPGPARAFTTESSTAPPTLLDARGWELVSPADKAGGSVQGPAANFGGGVFQAAAAGGGVTYSSSSSFAGGAGAPPASQYISTRGGEGWSTQNISTPQLSGSYGDEPDGAPFQLFSTDLSRALLLNGERCRGASGECPVVNPPLPGSAAPVGYQDYYLREAGGFGSILTGAELLNTALGPAQFELSLAGATPDLAHVVLTTCAALTADATEVAAPGGCDPTDQNLYDWSGGGLTLINRLPGQSIGNPGAKLGAQSGAISASGSRVYWAASDGDLYLDEAGQTKPVDESGEAVFQVASTDGRLGYFLKAGHLDRYEAGSETVTDLTPAGGVEGVLGASADGSRVYYGTVSGVFLSDGGTSVEVAPGPADPGDFPPATGTARVSADGTHLAFLSSASLTGYDNTDAATGLPDSEVFLYDAGSGRLLCASCNPTGERPLGPSTIPGAVANGAGATATDLYKPRALNGSGTRLFFDSRDRLLPQDTDAQPDVYEWEASGTGSCATQAVCLGLISSGRSSDGASFIDASTDGADAFFLTGESLVPSDPGSVDVYDAREGGGFAVPPTPIPCAGDACQPLPSPPEDPTPGTLIPAPPNPKPHFPKQHHKKPKKKHHKKQHAKKHHSKRHARSTR
jgi:hypothetical protein